MPGTFVNVMVPLGTRRRLSWPEVTHYRRPFPTAQARVPTHVFPREILGSHAFLTDVQAGLPRLAHLPTLIPGPDVTSPSGTASGTGSRRPSHTTTASCSSGPATASGRARMREWVFVDAADKDAVRARSHLLRQAARFVTGTTCSGS